MLTKKQPNMRSNIFSLRPFFPHAPALFSSCYNPLFLMYSPLFLIYNPVFINKIKGFRHTKTSKNKNLKYKKGGN